MPRALNVNRDAVRTLAIAVGIREAARQCGIPEATVQAWSNRENWIQQKNDAIAKKHANSLQPRATTKAFDALASYAKQTRFHLAKASTKASRKLAQSPPEKLIEPNTAKAARDWTDVAAKVHGWNTDSAGDRSNLQLNVLTGRGRTLVAIQSDDDAPRIAAGDLKSPALPSNEPDVAS